MKKIIITLLLLITLLAGCASATTSGGDSVNNDASSGATSEFYNEDLKYEAVISNQVENTYTIDMTITNTSDADIQSHIAGVNILAGENSFYAPTIDADYATIQLIPANSSVSATLSVDMQGEDAPTAITLFDDNGFQIITIEL